MGSRKFRKKPVVIEAIQFDTTEGVMAITKFTTGIASMCRVRDTFGDIRDYDMKIQTLEGEMIVSPGDWVIKGVQGEFYPCKPDIFAATYEEVAE